MVKVLKLFILGLTVWPLLYLCIFVLSGTIELFYSLNQLVLFPVMTIAISLSTIIFYFVELYHNQTMNRRSKMKWLQLFLFTGQFGMMFYWKNIFGKHWGYQFETELALSPLPFLMSADR